MNRVTSLYRRLLYAALGVLLLSGCEWTVMDWGNIALSPDKPTLMKIHGAAAMAVLLLLGAMLPAHVPLGWAIRRNKASGTGMLAVCGLLAVTGWLLYYAGDEGLRHGASLVHLVVGLVVPLVVAVHVLLTKRREKA